MSDSDSDTYLDVDVPQPSFAASMHKHYHQPLAASSMSAGDLSEKEEDAPSVASPRSPQFAAPLAIGAHSTNRETYARRRHSSEITSVPLVPSDNSDDDYDSFDDKAATTDIESTSSRLQVHGHAYRRRPATTKSSPYSSVEESSMEESNEDFETLKKLAKMNDRRKARSPQSDGGMVPQRSYRSSDAPATRFRRGGSGQPGGASTQQAATVKTSTVEVGSPSSSERRSPGSSRRQVRDVGNEALTDNETPSETRPRSLSRRKSELFDFVPVKEGGRFLPHGMRQSASLPSAAAPSPATVDLTTPRKQSTTYELRRSRLTGDMDRGVSRRSLAPGDSSLAKALAEALQFTIVGGAPNGATPPSEVIQDEKGEVIAGTVDQLIAHFINHAQDQNFLRQIILAKEQFTTPFEFLVYLVDLFDDAQEDFDDASERTQYRIRIVNILKKWFTTAPLDFKDERLSEKLQKFLSGLTSNPDTAAWSNLLTVSWRASIDSASIALSVAVGEYEHENAPASLMSSSLKKASEAYRKDPTSKIWKALNLEDIPLEELARQWALIDYNLFRKIPFWELLSKRWENENLSPHVTAVNERFNRVTRWVGTRIVQEFTAKKRAKALTFIICLAEKLVALRNYFGAMAIIFGISQSAISRLTSTWAKLSSSTIEKWKHLEAIGNPTSNFKVLRALQEAAVVPMVLAPTLLFRDMFFIEEGNEDWHDQSLRLINWEKVKLIGRIFSNMQRCNDVPYPYKHIPVLKKHLTRLYNLPDEEIEKASLIVEPHDN